MKLRTILQNAFWGLYLTFLCSMLFADSYKDIEWGTDIDVVISEKNLSVKTPDTDSQEEDQDEKVSISKISFFTIDVDMLAHFYEIPIVCNSNSPGPPPDVKNKEINRVLNHSYRSAFCNYQESVCPNITIIPINSDDDNEQSGCYEFYEGKYFCYANQIAAHSFDQVLSKLNKKYGKASKYSGDSLFQILGSFTYYCWVSGDTVILLNNYNEIDGSPKGRAECSLTYMSKTITDLIKKEIKKNISEQKNSEIEIRNKETKKDLDTVE